ncbi:hypothetical protein BD410DRAFT_835014 [Rickenella mellea]|uniref:DUF6533 domain-containing protein n=1 Tax=Rickenella mellea TaxID=50990 RepID=A0A4Y7QLB4_9AGAM|nr:hypothetical protein BD410DRAFT_835014 [Rickenella mellea]
MSDSGPTDLQAQLELLTAEYYSYSIIRYAYSVAAAILAYDYILTIDLEISQVWSQRLTGATLLYFMNRYIYPLNICLSMIEAFYPLNNNPFAVYEFSAIIPNTFGNVMINHMLLNLRHVSNTHTGGGLSEKTIPELAFAQNSIIGNLGAPLINDPDEFIEERTDIIEFAASSDLDIARDA